MWNRRQFIRTLGVLGGAVAVPFHWLGRVQAAVAPQADLLAGAEFIEGLLILPAGTAIPDVVQWPKAQMPSMCGVAAEKGKGSATVVAATQDSLHAASKSILAEFFRLDSSALGLVESPATVMYTADMQLIAIQSAYTHPSSAKDVAPVISLWLQFSFPRPFPIVLPDVTAADTRDSMSWSKFEGPGGVGVVLRTWVDATYYWVSGEVLHILAVEGSAKEQMIFDQKLATALVRARD